MLVRRTVCASGGSAVRKSAGVSHGAMQRGFCSTVFQCAQHLSRIKPVQMFLVIRDVPSYPLFIKWVESCRLTRVTNENHFDAEMGVNFTIYRGAFVSTAECVANDKTQEYKIVSTTRNSPMFESLVSTWHIKPYSDFGCTADYHIEFKFNNFLYQSASNYVVGIIGHKTLDCFVERAKGLYEKQNIAEVNKKLSPKKTKKPEVVVEQQKRPTRQEIAANFEFLPKDEDIDRTVLMFQTVRMLEQEGTLSKTELARCQALYFSDKHFVFQIKTLFQMFPTMEEIQANKSKVIFHLKTLIAQSHHQG